MAYSSNVLSDDDRKELLRIARVAIREHLRGGRIVPGAADVAALREPRALFVSLHAFGDGGVRELRGCIGTILAMLPLYRAAAEVAIGAATRDPRFPPLTLEELPLTEIEISVLGEPRAIRDVAQIELGTHGLHVTRFDARGLLLPQVAVENEWDRETFLAHACVKAGLPESAWRDAETIIQVFTAEVFRDESPPR
ncbi:MAG: AmmeMemoRadiSam system protein A [Myxococcota bacterium]|jgi:AmmeMemoRadiSam system protein A